MTIRDELIALQDSDGLLKPEAAVTWARENPGSELHAALEWDNTKAADEYRTWQVRRLISIHVVREGGVRELVSLSIDRVQPGGGYRDLSSVLNSQDLRDVLISDALGELERVRLKYETLTELAGVWRATDRVRKLREAPEAKRA